MKQRFEIGPKVRKSRRTVPQMRDTLEEILSAIEDDVPLSDAALHIRRAIAALDSARAMALMVLREAEAEVGVVH